MTRQRLLNPRLAFLAALLVLGIIVGVLSSEGARSTGAAARGTTPTTAAPSTSTTVANVTRAPVTTYPVTTHPATTAPVTTHPATTVGPTTAPTVHAGGVAAAPDRRVFVLGDSVVLGAAMAIPFDLGGWSVTIDAKVSRFLNQGIDVVKARRADIGSVAVVQLGNNYLGNRQQFAGQIDGMMSALAGVHRVVWVTVAEFMPNRRDVNDEIRAAAQRYPNVVVADWNAIWSANPSFTGSDRLHLDRAGAMAMAKVIGDAVGPPPS